MSRLSRRAFAFAAVAAIPMLAACDNGVGSTGGAKIDARVDATLAHMYSQYPSTRQLAQNSAGMLVMPLMTEVGLGLGGAYGQGALRVNGSTIDYYSATAANVGLQIGAQQYAHVLFFMTQEALEKFRRGKGWALGADVEYVFNDKATGLRADSTTGVAPIVAIVFGQAGVKMGATMEGTKYTRIIP